MPTFISFIRRYAVLFVAFGLFLVGMALMGLQAYLKYVTDRDWVYAIIWFGGLSLFVVGMVPMIKTWRRYRRVVSVNNDKERYV